MRISDWSSDVCSSDLVGAQPRAYWGAYGASKAALETLVGAYGEEVKNISAIRTHIVDLGATRTALRARAFPGADPDTLKAPAGVGLAMLALVISGKLGLRLCRAGGSHKGAGSGVGGRLKTK